MKGEIADDSVFGGFCWICCASETVCVAQGALLKCLLSILFHIFSD